MLYIIDELSRLKSNGTEQDIACIFPAAGKLLSDERRLKAGALKTPAQRNRSVLVYLLLRYGLRHEYGINKAVTISEEAYGKPYLTDYQDIHFSLSHCENAAACVIAKQAAGVDVQDIKPVKDNLARRILCDEEYAVFKMAADKNDYFCRMWAMKESYVKMTGQGIHGLFDIPAGLLNEITWTIHCGSNYICAATEKKLELHMLTMEDLLND